MIPAVTGQFVTALFHLTNKRGIVDHIAANHKEGAFGVILVKYIKNFRRFGGGVGSIKGEQNGRRV